MWVFSGKGEGYNERWRYFWEKHKEERERERERVNGIGTIRKKYRRRREYGSVCYQKLSFLLTID